MIAFLGVVLLALTLSPTTTAENLTDADCAAILQKLGATTNGSEIIDPNGSPPQSSDTNQLMAEMKKLQDGCMAEFSYGKVTKPDDPVKITIAYGYSTYYPHGCMATAEQFLIQECKDLLNKIGASTTDSAGSPPADPSKQMLDMEHLKFRCKAKFAYGRVDGSSDKVKITIAFRGSKYYLHRTMTKDDGKDDSKCSPSGSRDVSNCMHFYTLTALSTKDDPSKMAEEHQLFCFSMMKDCDIDFEYKEMSEDVLKYEVKYEADGVMQVMYSSMDMGEEETGYMRLSKVGDGNGLMIALGQIIHDPPADQQPAAQQPAPSAQQPAPAVQLLAPAVQQPAPAVQQPAPA